MTEQKHDDARGASHSDAELAVLRAENERLRNELERECADADKIFSAIGWGADRTRTEGGSLRVASLKQALSDIVAPGDGG